MLHYRFGQIMTVLCASVSDVHHVRHREARAVYLQRVSLHSEIPPVSAAGSNLPSGLCRFFLSSIFLLVRNINGFFSLFFSSQHLTLKMSENVVKRSEFV